MPKMHQPVVSPTRRLTPVLALLALTLAACGGGDTPTPVATTSADAPTAEATDPAVPTEAATKGGTLIIARAADSSTVDPADTFGTESSKVADQIFEGLIRFKDGATDIEPALAQSWESSPDGLVWTFSLRPGVTFQDGTPFNADAVVYSIERQMNPDHPAHNGTFNSWNNTFGRHISRVVAIDDLTVEIALDQPFAPILSGFAVSALSIISPTAMETHGKEWFDRHGVGTGPFAVTEWIPNDRLVLQANESYWGGRPNLDQVVFRVVPDTAERARLLDAGEVHIAEDLDNAALNLLEGNEAISIPKRPGLNTAYFAMNTSREPFTNLRVRQAISFALDLTNRVRATYGHAGVPAKNYLPPVLWGYNETVPPYQFDQDRARRLLAEAGYDQGFTFTLDVMENPRPYMPEPLEIAESIRDRLAEIGITVELRVNSWPDHLERVIRSSEADYDACLLGWIADMPDPHDFLFVQFHSSNADLTRSHQNLALYHNAEVDRLVEEAQRAASRQERVRLYRQVHVIVREEVPIIPIAHAFMILAHDSKVKDISVPVAIGNYGLASVWLDEAESAGADDPIE